MISRREFVFAGMGSAAMLTSGFYLGRHAAPDLKEGLPPPPMPRPSASVLTSVHTVSQAPWRVAVPLGASVVANQRLQQVAADLTGTVEQLLVADGDAVTAGQVVARLDAADTANQAQQTGADLARVRAQLDQARQHLQDMRALQAKDFVSQQVVRDAQTAVAVQEALVQQAGAGLAIKQKELAGRVVRSPVAGVVRGLKVSSGQFVQKGANLMEVVPTGGLEYELRIPAWLVPALDGALVEVEGKPLPILRRAVEVNADKSLSIYVAAPVVHPLGLVLPAVLVKPDMTQLTVPAAALIHEGAQTYVFVVRDEKAVRVPVSRIGAHLNLVAVEGLVAGDVVAVSGAGFLREGQAVRVAS